MQALLPDGTTKTLLHIPRWSFHWQQDYRFTAPVSLPRGHDGARCASPTTIPMQSRQSQSPACPRDARDSDPRTRWGICSCAGSCRPRLAIASSAAEGRGPRDAAANASAPSRSFGTTRRASEHLTFLGASYTDVGRFADGIARTRPGLMPARPPVLEGSSRAWRRAVQIREGRRGWIEQVSRSGCASTLRTRPSSSISARRSSRLVRRLLEKLR